MCSTTATGRTGPDLPEWLEPVRQVVGEVTAEGFSRHRPPAGVRPRRSAVLVLFGSGVCGPELLLTERAHDMRSHPGQVSFPGGAVEDGDTGPVEAALREAQEETGLDPAGVTVFGTLPDLWLAHSSFAVTPVLAWWRTPSPTGVVDPGEVHAVLRTPLAQLLDPGRRFSVALPSGGTGPAFFVGERRLVLWGFTAGIVSRLFEMAGWSRPWDAGDVRRLPAYMLPGDG